MEKEQVEIIGIVDKGIWRKRNAESHYQECNFQLESGEDIWCIWFIPNIRRGWKVRVVGSWSEHKKYINATYVERIFEKQKDKQIQLKEFMK
ncbi:MAG: hypothetical protein QXW97_00295 [Candidatus Pacearchaeota archaeon]